MITASIALTSGCERRDQPAAVPAVSPEPAAQPVPQKPPPPAQFAGSAACAECHADVAARWRESEHARAMQKAGADTVLGDFAGKAFRDGPVTWKFERGEGFRARSEGPERGAFEIAYTIGIDPLQQYLVAFPDGRLQPLHVAWDARPAQAGGQRWFSIHAERTAAGDPGHWKSFAMTWNATCADCHVTGFRKGFDVTANRYDSTWSELGVGCEACHGPGSRHIEWARAGAKGSADRGLEVPMQALRANSGAGRPSPEVDTCAGCHSQRARLTEQPRAGNAFHDDYEPALHDGMLYHDDGQVAAQVYEWGSFVQTGKYAAGVRCSDCHEPHSGELRAEVNALCGSCHEPARFDVPAHHHHTASPTPTCVDCHMPESVILAIDAKRDHGFQVPRPDLTLRVGTPNACASCHAKRGDEWAAQAVENWRAGAAPRTHFAERLHARRSGGGAARSKLSALVADTGAPAIARATALLELAGDPPRDRIDKAARASDPVLRLAAARASANLSARERVLGIARLLEDPRRAVRIEAAAALANVPDEELSEAQREVRRRALDEYRAAIAIASDTPAAHAILAVLLQQQGDATTAEAAYLTALRLVDTFVPAYTGLADLYAAENRVAEGEALLRRGIARLPESPDLHYGLGMMLGRQEKTKAALAELGQATRLGPESPYFAYVYAVALNEDRQNEKALRVLRSALELHPLDQNLLGATAVIARDTGRLDEALAAARRLAELFPGQPEPSAMIEEIEGLRSGSPEMVTAPEPNE